MIAIRRNSQQRDSMSSYICPDNGYRGSLSKKGIQPKNHMKDNLLELRQAQEKIRQKKEEDSRPEKPLYKLPQFKDVESRLYESRIEKENIQISARRRASFSNDDEERRFLFKGQSDLRREELAKERRNIRGELERKLEQARFEAAEDPLTPRKAAVPRSNEAPLLRGPSDADFITRNKMEAMTMAPPKKGINSGLERHEDFGRVPQYLEQRKQQWAEEEEEMRRRMPDPNCPPGMCLMPESERLNTLETLENSRAEALSQLRKLPFVIETPTMRKKQEFLEGKLREIDHALSIFSKPKVYVALDR